MLSFQEQYGLINKIYNYDIDEDSIKVFITRGNTNEQIYNKKWILRVFRYKLNLIDFSDGFTKLVKLYIKFFLINNEVYYYDNQENKVYELPTSETTIYDVFTDELIITYNHESTDVLIFYLPYVIYDSCCIPFSIGFNDSKRLKDVDNIVIKDHDILTMDYKELQYLKTLYHVLKNDDIDSFIDICTRFPECIDSVYKYRFYSVKIFELTVLFDAIKCFKYMIMNNYYNNTDKHYYYHLVEFAVVANNLEIVRLLENIGFSIINSRRAFNNCIDYHRNNILKYILLKNPFNNDIDDFFERSLVSYNYELMLYILENYDYIPNDISYHNNIHMPAILYISNKYNKEFSENSLDKILIQEPTVE